MISIIITSYKEPKTIGRAIKSVLNNNIKEEYEIIVVVPDEATLKEAKKYKQVKTIKDKGKGKPAALNIAVSEAKGEILILTDGDVYVGKNSLSQLVNKIKGPDIGAVSGRPVSINLRNTMLGFWAYILTEIANKRRLKAIKIKKRFFCSGYLFAIKKKLFPKLPEELLSEDGFISHKVYESGYKIIYSDRSLVYVKYPSNFSDWIKQKRRSAGGYKQIKKLIGVEMRSFRKESSGAIELLAFVKNLKNLFWLFVLFLSRIYLWVLIYKDIGIKNKKHDKIWLRVESTK